MINLNYLKRIAKISKLIFLELIIKNLKRILKNKIKIKKFKNLKDILNEIFLDIKKQKVKKKYNFF